jgi:hypothetical protein
MKRDSSVLAPVPDADTLPGSGLSDDPPWPTSTSSQEVRTESAPVSRETSSEAPQPIVPVQDPGAAVVVAPTDQPAMPGGEAPSEGGKRARGRPRKVIDEGMSPEQRAALSSVTPAPPRPIPKATPAKRMVDYTSLGNVAANLWFNIGVMILGKEWEPDAGAGEPAIVAGAFKDYFQSKNISEIDPTVSLCLVLGSYTLARLNKPTIQSRIKGAFTWVRDRVKNLRTRS